MAPRHALPRSPWPARVRRIGPALAAAAVVAAGVVAAGVVAAGVAVSTSGAESASMIAIASATAAGTNESAADRQRAADRADRAARTSPGPTPSAPPSAAAPSTAAPAPPPPPPAWVNPMPGVPLSSCFGLRWGVPHQGIDFAGDAGTKILAVGAGTVIEAGWAYAGYGISVVVDHGNGYLSHYAHASQALVTVGQTVQPGTPLALEGSTGDSTGPHLHFEIHQGTLWNQIDPAPWLRAHGVAVNGC